MTLPCRTAPSVVGRALWRRRAAGWCHVQCLDCGCRTVEMAYHSEEERREMAEKVALSWNLGKVIYTGPATERLLWKTVPSHSEHKRPEEPNRFLRFFAYGKSFLPEAP